MIFMKIYYLIEVQERIKKWTLMSNYKEIKGVLNMLMLLLFQLEILTRVIEDKKMKKKSIIHLNHI